MFSNKSRLNPHKIEMVDMTSFLHILAPLMPGLTTGEIQLVKESELCLLLGDPKANPSRGLTTYMVTHPHPTPHSHQVDE